MSEAVLKSEKEFELFFDFFYISFEIIRLKNLIWMILRE